jgi:S1-C subfamily serine protease
MTVPAPAEDAKSALSGKDIFQRVLRSAVWIAHAADTGDGRMGVASGSGSLIDMAGRHVLTNFHVVGNQDAVSVFFPEFDGNKKLIAVRDHYVKKLFSSGGIRGKVVYRDRKRDLAIIQLPQLPAGVGPVPLAAESVGPGDSVHSIGNPGASGALWAYTPGSVKSIYPKKWAVPDFIERKLYQFEATVVETTSPVNAGDSGGPLVNSRGELVAVTQGGVSAVGTISYFIDISEVRSVLTAAKIRIASPILASSSETAGAKPGADSAALEAERQEAAAQTKLNVARQLYIDRPGKYREKLEEVIKMFPDTKAAKEAKATLAKMK